MFDGLKSLSMLPTLMKEMPRLKAEMEAVRGRLIDIRVTAETGGGAVRVTASGDMRVCAVELDPSMMTGLVDPALADDRMIAEDLIAGAVNAALEKARAAAEQEFSQAAAGLGLPLPPGGLGGFLQ